MSRIGREMQVLRALILHNTDNMSATVFAHDGLKAEKKKSFPIHHDYDRCKYLSEFFFFFVALGLFLLYTSWRTEISELLKGYKCCGVQLHLMLASQPRSEDD